MKLKQLVVLAIALLFVLPACQEPQILPTEPAPVVEISEPVAEIVPTDTAVPQPTNESTPKPTNEPAAAPPTMFPETAVTQPSTENITIEAADGLLLHATLSMPGGIAPFPGVILLHMLGSDRQVWVDVGLTDALLADGYAVLALDMRGHGESGSDREWEKADDDLMRVWQYFVGLENVDEGETAVIGASIGSNMALRTGANQPAIKTVVLLSPGLDYRRVTTDDAIVLYGDRPILIVASEEDSYAADSSRTLAELAQGEAVLQMYNGAGHGTNMFAAEPGLTQLLLDWLNQFLLES
ncbi:MAG: alpha/beta fold hydrolase [Anaerolineales bacterium]|nr:alpha/beta fold hydrolase [Anaerolineales bacterium]